MTDEQPAEEPGWQYLLRQFEADRWFAHQKLFPHRHPLPPSDAHRELVLALHSAEARRSIEGFRGFAKSTYLEEAAIVRGGFREFRHLLILGASEARACDRLAAIKSELVNNDLVRFLFRPDWSQATHKWQEAQIVISLGGQRIRMLALGRDQQLLGVKWEDIRPDAFLVDDVEDPEERRSDTDRAATWNWLLRSFLPALVDPLRTWGRFVGTRRGKGSLPERLEEAGVPVSRFPIEHIGETGERVATWPVPGKQLDDIDRLRMLYRGDMHTFMEEYMCQPAGDQQRDFSEGMIRLVPRERSWEAVYAMIDPASSVNRHSATTGWAVWSWIGRRLVVWDAGAENLLPDKIVALAYEIIDRFDPIWLGVERDGLNQFLMQPLRHEQVRRGMAVAPVRPVAAISGTAGHGKIAFIRGLRAFGEAGEIEFAKPLPELQAQMLSFPWGKIDAPNALAYCQTMRPAAPIYDAFGMEHVAASLEYDTRQDLWLAANATPGLVTAVLLQSSLGRTQILQDFALEGTPAEIVPLLMRDVGLAFRATPKICLGPMHFDRWSNIGLAQAFRQIPIEVEPGTSPERGRELLRADLPKMPHGQPVVQVSRAARWTLNALAGGYTRVLQKGGVLSGEAESGVYRTLMEGLESCLGRMEAVVADDSAGNWAYTPNGQRYRRYARA